MDRSVDSLPSPGILIQAWHCDDTQPAIQKSAYEVRRLLLKDPGRSAWVERQHRGAFLLTPVTGCAQAPPHQCQTAHLPQSHL